MSDLSQNGTSSGTLSGSAGQDRPASRDGSHYLRALGENVRAARARRGMSRKALAHDSGVSERFLAQLESGTGNASILVLRQIVQALGIELETILPGRTLDSSDVSDTFELLRRLAPADRAKARVLLQQLADGNVGKRTDRIALIGLRGAGKSTIGKVLAEKLGVGFFELDRLIEKDSSLSLTMIFDMYGQSGFRRFEHRCFEELLKREQRFVVATGGSIVSEAATYEHLLANCYTIWLRANPETHMSRVIAQGDLRPMAHNPEAMSALERILAEREPLYRKADTTVNTSGRTVEEVLSECLNAVSESAINAQM